MQNLLRTLCIGRRFRPPPRYPVDSKIGDQREGGNSRILGRK